MDGFEDDGAIGETWCEALPGVVRIGGTSDAAKAKQLSELAAHIKRQDAVLRPSRANRSAAIFEIGRALFSAKELLPYGGFLSWVEQEFDWPERMAQHCMRVTRVLGDRAETVSGLTLRALIALAAKTTPEALRTGILDELDDGVELTSREIEERVRAARGDTEADPQTKKAENARQAAEYLRARLPAAALVTLAALLDGADMKAFAQALRPAEHADWPIPG